MKFGYRSAIFDGVLLALIEEPGSCSIESIMGLMRSLQLSFSNISTNCSYFHHTSPCN
jgi:hypothetical protein